MARNGAFYTDTLSTPLRIAQVVGLTSTVSPLLHEPDGCQPLGQAFLAGKTFTSSFSTVPALLLAPAPLLAKQWKKQFEADKIVAPVVALFSSGIFSYIAYRGTSCN